MAPAASRPFQRARTRPLPNSPFAMVNSRPSRRIATRRWSARRSENSIFAASVSHSQTGEKTLSTRVCEIGLGSSFRRCVTANAVAVAVNKTSARIVGAFRFTAARLYAEPNSEGREAQREPDGDHVARLLHVQQLDPAQGKNAREAEPQRVLWEVQRVAAGDPDARDRAEQQPSDRMQVDVALDEVPEACDPQERGGVEDVRSDDARDRQGIDHHHHEAEERPAADGRQPDDVTEHGPDDHGADFVLPRHDEARLA